jgi:hypothetical protein
VKEYSKYNRERKIYTLNCTPIGSLKTERTMHHTMTTEDDDNHKVMTPPPHQYRTGKIYTTKGIFSLGGRGRDKL